jgi:NADH:ubiquinone oxidoreductase subunit 4 (subunit M)
MFIILNFFYNNAFLSTILFNLINLFIYHEILLLNFLLIYLLITIILFFIPKTNLFLVKKISLFLTVYTFFIFIYIYYLINNFSLIYYFFYKINNIFSENLSIEYSIGIDTISYLFLLFTSIVLILLNGYEFYQVFQLRIFVKNQ